MLLKKLDIGGVVTANNVFLAPIAGYSDFSLRGICSELGAGLCFTELISCKGLLYDSQKTMELLETDPSERVKAVQIFGSDPDIMRKAAESDELAKFDIIDINMGCPVPKLYKNGEGCALMQNFALASRIISECAKSNKPVTVKFRTGMFKALPIAAEFAKMCEDSGAAAVTVHGRARESYYSGEVYFAEIARVKRAVNIPVIANGGIFSVADAKKMQDETGADGVMIGRAALENPNIFAALTGAAPRAKELIIIDQIDRLAKRSDKVSVARIMRKRIAFYIKGVIGSKKYKQEIFACEDTDSLKLLVKEIFN